jgi:hypothetical protein
MRSLVLTEQEIAEFRSLVVIGNPDQCWPWLGEMRVDGYPRFQRKWLAHRVAYALAHNVTIVNGQVYHSCESMICCNPQHLIFIDEETRSLINLKRNLGLDATAIANDLMLPVHVIKRVPK